MLQLAGASVLCSACGRDGPGVRWQVRAARRAPAPRAVALCVACAGADPADALLRLADVAGVAVRPGDEVDVRLAEGTEVCAECGGDGGWHDCGDDVCRCAVQEIDRDCPYCGGAGFRSRGAPRP